MTRFTTANHSVNNYIADCKVYLTNLAVLPNSVYFWNVEDKPRTLVPYDCLVEIISLLEFQALIDAAARALLELSILACLQVT